MREAVSAKLGTTDRRRLHDRVVEVRKAFGPMSVADAHSVIASQCGIPIHRYLKEPDLSRVREILARGAASPRVAATAGVARGASKSRAVLREVVIDGGRLVMDDPILPPPVVADARRMAGIYPLTYVFENSVREFVVRVMQKRHGADWWKHSLVPAKVIRDVEATKRNEASVPWHGERGSHSIHYTTIEHLKSIITTNENWPLFQPILGEQNAVSYLIQVIEQSRHTIAHHNLLSDDDAERLKVNIKAWQKLLRDKKHLI